MLWQTVIEGETASKANSRELVIIDGKQRFIKSAKARAWTNSAISHLIVKRPARALEGDLGINCRIFYASRRPDLDASLVYDALQKAGVVKNDRSFREQHTWWGLDKNRPRVEVSIFRIVAPEIAA